MFTPGLGDPEPRRVDAHAFSNHFFVSETASDGGRVPCPMAVKRITAIEVLFAAATEAAGAGQTQPTHDFAVNAYGHQRC